MKRVFTKLTLALFVIVVYTNVTLAQICPGVTNLTATVSPYNTVTLNWTSPPQSEWPAEDIDYRFYNGGDWIGNGYNDAELSSWTTPVLAVGTHNLGVLVYYYNSSDLVCIADTVFVEATITELYTCPVVTNLYATINSDNTVVLNWTNPPQSEWPTENIDHRFYDVEDFLGVDYTGEISSWITPVLMSGTHNIGVQICYYNTGVCIHLSDIVFVEVEILENYYCPSVENLTATVNENNSVTLNWTIPDSSTWPSTCEGDLSFIFGVGEMQYGSSDIDDLTSWTSGVFPDGTYTFVVSIEYRNNIGHYVCSAQAYTTVTIGEIACPPVENLTATVNPDNTVTLNWTNPDSSTWPSDCQGNLNFDFYIEDYVGYDDTDNLTTWTSNVLSNGTHILRVIVSYHDNNGIFICEAEANIILTISGSFDCPSVTNLTATVNPDNTVTLNWTNQEPPSNCVDTYYEFYLGATYLWDIDIDGLTSWTTDVLTNGTHTMSVVVYYYDTNLDLICSAITSTTVTISGSLDCPPVTDLNATINENNTVTLTWTNPQPAEFPTGCTGNFDFEFYDGIYFIGYDETDDLTSWTTPVLSPGTRTLAVVVEYYDDSFNYICSAEANITVITTDIGDIKSSLFSAEIFPNPANDILNIVSDSEIISYELYDAVGRLMLNDSNVSNTESLVNVSSLKHGMYMLRLNTMNGSGTYKIIKN